MYKTVLFLLVLLLLLFVLSCSVPKNINQTKTIKFTSLFGNFSMQTPLTWTYIEIPGVPSFDGKIAMDNNDTLNFSYGFWSSLQKGNELTTFDDFGKYVKAKKYEYKIDGYNAYVITPNDYDSNICRLYIDSLYSNSLTITKFDLYGKDLSEENQNLFFKVIETIKFEK